MSNSNLLPPWFDSVTGQSYGPRTLTTYQSQCANFKDWSFRAQGKERPEAKLVHQYARKHHAELPDSILETYRQIYVRGMSLNEAAEDSGLSRSTVRTYQKRLRERAEVWERGKL